MERNGFLAVSGGWMHVWAGLKGISGRAVRARLVRWVPLAACPPVRIDARGPRADKQLVAPETR